MHNHNDELGAANTTKRAETRMTMTCERAIILAQKAEGIVPPPPLDTHFITQYKQWSTIFCMVETLVN